MRSHKSRVICTATSLVSPDRVDRYAASGSAICEVGRSTSASSSIASAASSAIVSPAKLTASASGRRPVPPHTGQGTVSTYCSARSRIDALFEFASVCMTWRSALENVPV